MYNLPKKSKGAVLTAENWNNSVEAIQDALNRSSDFQTMLPSVQAANRWTGGRSVVDKGVTAQDSCDMWDRLLRYFATCGQETPLSGSLKIG